MINRVDLTKRGMETDPQQQNPSEAAPPKPKRRSIWQQLIAPKRITPFECLVLMIDLLGFVVLIYSLRLLVKQTEAMTIQTRLLTDQAQQSVLQTQAQAQALESSVYQGILDKQLEMDQVLIENADLRPYFAEGKPIRAIDPRYQRVLAIAEYQLDFFDLLLRQSQYLALLDRKGQAWAAWETYIRDSFARSPILCEHLQQIQTWYTPELLDFARQSGCWPFQSEVKRP